MLLAAAGDAIQAVLPATLIRAHEAVLKGPRGLEAAMMSIIQALSKEEKPDAILAIAYRLQALTHLMHGRDDLPGLTMNLHGRDYKLVSEAALHAAAVCPLTLQESIGDVRFDEAEFVTVALGVTQPEGSG